MEHKEEFEVLHYNPFLGYRTVSPSPDTVKTDPSGWVWTDEGVDPPSRRMTDGGYPWTICTSVSTFVYYLFITTDKVKSSRGRGKVWCYERQGTITVKVCLL